MASTNKWIKNILKALFVSWLLALILVIIELTITPVPDLITLNISLVFVLIIGILAYKSHLNPEVFTISYPYEELNLSEHAVAQFKQKLQSIMLEEQLFLDSKLTIQVLADKVDIPRKKVSYLLNQSLGLNFFDYVNSFRVNHFKQLLTDPQFSPYTIQALAEKSGFQSMSTAYGAFKKVTGMTPAKYKRALKM